MPWPEGKRKLRISPKDSQDLGQKKEGGGTHQRNLAEVTQIQSVDFPLQVSLEIHILFTEAKELRSGEQPQAE